MTAVKTLHEPELDGKRPTEFQRSNRKRPARNRTDDVGTVAVIVILRDQHSYNHKRGNITRQMSVASARVSEVAAHVEKALFGEDAA